MGGNDNVDILEKFDEYEVDSSDEEDIANTIGNVPLEWYRDFDHLGYDLDGKQILKPADFDSSKIDNFLASVDDPDHWRTVTDPRSGRKHVLTSDELELIESIFNRRTPKGSGEIPPLKLLPDKPMVTPLNRAPPSKISFMEMKPYELKKIRQLRYALRKGWLKPREKKSSFDELPKFYDIWANNPDGNQHKGLPAPKEQLPGHSESYHPPPEYIPDEDETKEYNESKDEKRASAFLPTNYDTLRHVPAYSNAIRERFERCLDLYLCPRRLKMKIRATLDDVLPKRLPKPEDLRPFPHLPCYQFTNHTDVITSLSCTEQFLLSSSKDGLICLWEIQSSRCLFSRNFESPVECAAFCPDSSLIAVCTLKRLHLLTVPFANEKFLSKGKETLTKISNAIQSENSVLDWNCDSDEEIVIEHPHKIASVSWHNKGDYLASVCEDGGAKQSVYFHRLSNKVTQLPFSKLAGTVVQVIFHPSKAHLFVATLKTVKVYDLTKQTLIKRFAEGSRSITSMAVHPSGDHVVVTGRDDKVAWFDFDLSSKPYKMMRHHSKIVNAVDVHRRLPLFATASDDSTVVVSHCKVTDDLSENALIVPLKQLKVSSPTTSVCFHTKLPWLFAGTANGKIQLFTH